MPPLPNDPSDLYPSIKRRLDDIETFQVPRLAKCTGPVGLQRELADETKSDLEQVRRGIEMCYELGEIIGRSGKEENRTICHAFEERLKGVRTEYRRAIIISKKQIASSSTSRHMLRRDDELDGELDQEETKQSGSNMQDDALQTRTNEVTDALRRTTQTMQTELERSVLSVQMLEDSTRTLRSTTNLYDTYTNLLDASGQLIKQLEKADWYDRLLILAAFLFFLLCVGWIIKRRVLDRVVGGVGWWVGGSFRLIGMGLGLGGKVKLSNAVEKANVGAGKVGRTPDGIGRVGLAGAKENAPRVSADKEAIVPDISIIDSAVPPVPSDGSEVRSRIGDSRDEL